jgi:hypothetical protein
MDVDDVDVAAAERELEAARRDGADTSSSSDGAWRTLLASSEFTVAVESCMRTLIAERSRTVSMPAVGECSLTCRAYTDAYEALVYASASASAPPSRRESQLLLPHIVDPLTRTRLHVCVPSLCALPSSTLLHAHERTSLVRSLTHHALTEPLETGGGVYYCHVHERVHVCVPATCACSQPAARGARVCALSSRVLNTTLELAYGDGVTSISDELAHTRAREDEERTYANAARRSNATSAIEHVMHTATAQMRESRALGRPSSSSSSSPLTAAAAAAARESMVVDADAADDAEYADVDVPDMDAIPADGEANTFGDDTAPVLVRLYSEAYAAVQHLLPSDERAAIETATRQSVVDDASRREATHFEHMRKAGEPLSVPTMLQIELRAFNQRRILPELCMPEHSIARIQAYFALVAMEAHMQLTAAALRCAAVERNEKRAAIFRRYPSLSFAAVVPNVLDILSRGLRVRGEAIALADTIASMAPESQALQALGYDESLVTDAKKAMKAVITAAVLAGEPLYTLQLTQLDHALIFYSRTSVVSLFLAERRRRLAAATHTAM